MSAVLHSQGRITPPADEDNGKPAGDEPGGQLSLQRAGDAVATVAAATAPWLKCLIKPLEAAQKTLKGHAGISEGEAVNIISNAIAALTVASVGKDNRGIHARDEWARAVKSIVAKFGTVDDTVSALISRHASRFIITWMDAATRQSALSWAAKHEGDVRLLRKAGLLPMVEVIKELAGIHVYDACLGKYSCPLLPAGGANASDNSASDSNRHQPARRDIVTSMTLLVASKKAKGAILDEAGHATPVLVLRARNLSSKRLNIIGMTGSMRQEDSSDGAMPGCWTLLDVDVPAGAQGQATGTGTDRAAWDAVAAFPCPAELLGMSAEEWAEQHADTAIAVPVAVETPEDDKAGSALGSRKRKTAGQDAPLAMPFDAYLLYREVE